MKGVILVAGKAGGI